MKIVFAFFLFFAFFPQSVAAAEKNFEVSIQNTFTVTESGNTLVSQKVQIKNRTEFYYTPSYQVNIGLDDLQNIQVVDNGGPIPFTIKEEQDSGKGIVVNFKDRVVGLDKVNEFTISFESKSIALSRGSIWEVTIPGIADPSVFSTYTTLLRVPEEFGSATVSKPQKTGILNTSQLVFSKEDLGRSGILLLFGEYQYYKFNLFYHISNSNLFPVKTEIALPSDTNYQQVSVKGISPPPSNVYKDPDGNWLAEYNLPPQKKLDIEAEVVVKLSSSPISENLSEAQRKNYIKSQEYWEIRDGLIQDEVKNLNTPRDIYEYVVNKLSYNYEKVTSKNTRLGAKNALLDPKNAVCLEFNDLFITLARARGIPARSVEGYAYTENSKLRPLSLVKDVLHAWPEYYDDEKQSWIMVDPTWGNTTKGMDYFNSFDFDHIAFVINGQDSTYPVPAGGYKFTPDSKDVHVEFSDESEFDSTVQTKISADFPSFTLSSFPIRGSLEVTNTGKAILNEKNVTVRSDFSPHEQVFIIDSIPPFGKKTIPVFFQSTPFLTNKAFEVTMLYEGNFLKKTVRVGVVPDNYLVLGGGIVAGFIFISLIAYASWRLLIQRPKR